MLTSVEIHVKAVAKKINPEDPGGLPIDHSTEATPFILSGELLTDFVEFFLFQRTGEQDRSHIFTGQEILDALMARPRNDMEQGFNNRISRSIEVAPGETFREKILHLFGEEKVRELYESAP